MIKRSRGSHLVRREQWYELVRETLEAFDCPRALTVWLLFSSGEHRQLVELGFDANDYRSPSDVSTAYAATKLLSKCKGLKTQIDTAAVAIEAARAAETHCRETNRFFRMLASGAIRDTRGLDAELFSRVRSKIADILGPVPEWRNLGTLPSDAVEAFYAEGRRTFSDRGWSPGRSTSAFGDNVSPVGKYKSTPHCTVSARNYALRELQDSSLWSQSVLDSDGPCSVISLDWALTNSNVMLTVPKNAKTDRVICYEPHMNIWLQLKVGSYIRRRLLSRGVDLNDQTINQQRALVGSKDGSLATIDLTMASDLLSAEVVVQLLPIDWWVLLDDLRSKYTTWPTGETLKNEKFSSMGNGFTFELESLIFFAIASAVAGSDVTVYGDDIIVPTRAYSDTVYALEFFGFKVNTKKSYSAGTLFRESCGKHYVGGVDVSPFFLRRPIRSTSGVVLLHNLYRQWDSQSHGGYEFLSRKAAKLLSKWRTRHPTHMGPAFQEGRAVDGATRLFFSMDGHYHVNFDEASPSRRRALSGRSDDGWQGWWFNTRAAMVASYWDVGSEVGISLAPAVLCAATGPKRTLEFLGSHLRRKDVRYVTIRTSCHSWPGCWVTS